MRRTTANNRAECNNRVTVVARGKFLNGERQFERTRNPDDQDIFVGYTVAAQCVERAF